MIDLNELEQGDTVVFRDGQKATVNYVCDNGYDGIKVYFFMIGIYNEPFQFNDDYHKNGVIKFHDEIGLDIVQIIKKPKQWTDEDMLAACQLGIDTQLNDVFSLQCSVINFNEWLRKRKESKDDRNNTTS